MGSHARLTAIVFLFALAACGEDGPDGLDAVLKDPGELRGMPALEIEKLFGAPGFRRRDGEARIWRYSAAVCHLDLFFYPAKEVPGRPLVASHFEIRNVGDEAVSSRRCLADIAAAKKNGA